MASVESLGFEHKPPHGLSPTCGKGSIHVLDELRNESVGNLELRGELNVCDSFSPVDMEATPAGRKEGDLIKFPGTRLMTDLPTNELTVC